MTSEIDKLKEDLKSTYIKINELSAERAKYSYGTPEYQRAQTLVASAEYQFGKILEKLREKGIREL